MQFQYNFDSQKFRCSTKHFTVLPVFSWHWYIIIVTRVEKNTWRKKTFITSLQKKYPMRSCEHILNCEGYFQFKKNIFLKISTSHLLWKESKANNEWWAAIEKCAHKCLKSPTNNSLASWHVIARRRRGGERAARLRARNSFPFLPKNWARSSGQSLCRLAAAS